MKVEIDLGAIQRNYRRLSAAAQKPLIPMLKANAYGHGASMVARVIEAETVGVATEQEGIPMRDLGKKVLVTAPSFSSLSLCARYGMIPLIGDFDLMKRAAACGVRRCRIKINSGMNRLGFKGEKACRSAAEYLTRAGVAIEGADTHYKEDADQNVLSQNAAFDSCLSAIREGIICGGGVPDFKTSVTACGALFSSSYDELRVGLSLYGYHSGEWTAGLPLEPAMKVTTEIIGKKRLPRGGTLGYSGVYRAPKRVFAYTVLGGYGDGISREERGRKVLSAGRRLKIAAVSMDSFEMVSEDVDLPVGGRVIILSKGLDAAYIASRRGTIPYEVLLGFDVPRAEKTYVR